MGGFWEDADLVSTYSRARAIAHAPDLASTQRFHPRQLHTKITAYRLVANEPNATLSEVLDNAPARRNHV